MYTICLLVLLASLEYKCVQAAGIPFSTRQSSTAVELWEACNYPSQGINGPLPCSSGECICKDDTYAQCREQIGGSWAPEPTWQCQQPGGSATGTSPSTDDTSSIASKAKLSGNSVGSVGDSLEAAAPNTLSLDTSSSGTGSQQAATIGGCDSTNAPAGWDGVASTSYYGWMGSACMCGETSWQWAGGSGVYNGAVNQKLFNGSTPDGLPYCGSACGTCYELSTSGFNAYNDGPASGSTITLQIVDACYSSGSEWCGSLSDDYKDRSSCGVHFDIQTGAPGTSGQAMVGADGTTWNSGGQIVYYRQTACPQTLTSSYKSSCTC